MPWSEMVDLELTDDEKLDLSLPLAIADQPDYPYGMRVCMTSRELEKFGLDSGDFKVGEIVMFKCFAKVRSVSSDDGPMGPCERVECQIENMAIMGEGDDEC